MASKPSHRFEYHRFRRRRGDGAPRPACQGDRDAARTSATIPSSDGELAVAAPVIAPTVEAESSEVPPAAAAPSGDSQTKVGRGGGRGNMAPRRPRVCKYYVADGYCYFGDECRFYHPRNLDTRPAQRPFQPASKPVARPNQAFLSSDQLNSEAQTASRRSEIASLKRRFPNHRTIPANNRDADTFLIDFVASDPDWPFDVKNVELKATFPAGYPITPAVIEASEGHLPELVVRKLSSAIGDWLRITHEQQQSKNAFEPVMRTFLRWFDRSVLNLFIEGLRKTKMVVDAQSAGISLAVLPKVEAVEAPAADQPTPVDDDENETVAVKSEETKSDSPTQSLSLPECSTKNASERDVTDKLSSLTISTEKVSGSTEIRLTSCILGENVASLTPVKLALSVQCRRCPTHGEMVVSSNCKTTNSSCSRCSQKWSLDFIPGIVHSASVTLGQLIPTGCRPDDLVLLASEFKLTCLQCNKEMILKSVAYGAPFKTWCQGCHTKSELGINAVRFHCENPLDSNIGAVPAAIKPIKKKPAPGGPRIVEGEPLPDNGTCKHYKKSFRWFRFPCCGKVYPCDLCHEENESHEMKFANRIVCGYCSKEQPYQTSKVCSSCKGSVVRAKTQHWEGGKGCRDAVQMAKGDDRKYTNSRLKTVSRHKQAELATKTKKKRMNKIAGDE